MATIIEDVDESTDDSLASHPIILASLVGWLINDHILKDLYGNWLTGKASDVFGLIVFPVLVALPLQRLGSPAIRRWSLPFGSVVTALLFVAINVSTWASDATSSVLSLAIPSGLTPDYTDLATLPALAVVYIVRSREFPAPSLDFRVKKTLSRIVFGVGVFASITSGVPVAAGTAIFTGTAVLSADSPTLEVPFTISLDGPKVVLDDVELNWSGTAVGPGTLTGRSISTSIENRYRKGGVARYQLEDLSLAPVELEWRIEIPTEEGGDPIASVDAPPDETLEPVAEVEVPPVSGGSVTEWMVTTQSDTVDIRLKGWDIPVTAVTAEGSFQLDRQTIPISLPTDCPDSGCEFAILLTSEDPNGLGWVRMWADEPITVEVQQRDLEVVSEVSQEVPNTSPNKRDILDFDLTISPPDIDPDSEATTGEASDRFPDYVTVEVTCDPARDLGDPVLDQCSGGGTILADDCCDEPFDIWFLSNTDVENVPTPVRVTVVVRYLSLRSTVLANPVTIELTPT